MLVGFKKGLSKAFGAVALALGCGMMAPPSAVADTVANQPERSSVNTTHLFVESDAPLTFVPSDQTQLYLPGQDEPTIISFNPFDSSSYGLHTSEDITYNAMVSNSGNGVRVATKDIADDRLRSFTQMIDYDRGTQVFLNAGQSITYRFEMDAFLSGNSDGSSRATSEIGIVSENGDFLGYCSRLTGAWTALGHTSFQAECNLDYRNDTGAGQNVYLLSNFAASAESGPYRYSGVDLGIAPWEPLPAVPEPSTYGMMLAGGAALAAAMRRRPKAVNANAQGGVSGPAASMG